MSANLRVAQAYRPQITGGSGSLNKVSLIGNIDVAGASASKRRTAHVVTILIRSPSKTGRSHKSGPFSVPVATNTVVFID